MVGAPRSTTSMSASIAACHSGSAASFFGRPVTYVAASRSVRSFSPLGRTIGSSNSRDHPRSLMTPTLLIEFDMRTGRRAGRMVEIARTAIAGRAFRHLRRCRHTRHPKAYRDGFHQCLRRMQVIDKPFCVVLFLTSPCGAARSSLSAPHATNLSASSSAA